MIPEQLYREGVRQMVGGFLPKQVRIMIRMDMELMWQELFELYEIMVFELYE